MKAALVKIGNSHGIRIPKAIIEQCGFEKEVDLEVREHALVIKPAQQTRHDWESAFEKMAANGDDRLLEIPPSTWNEAEWQ